MVTKADLFVVPPVDMGTCKIPAQQPILMCLECGNQASANPGDYWNRPDTYQFTCHGCGNPMELGYIRTILEPASKPLTSQAD